MAQKVAYQTIIEYHRTHGGSLSATAKAVGVTRQTVRSALRQAGVYARPGIEQKSVAEAVQEAPAAAGSSTSADSPDSAETNQKNDKQDDAVSEEKWQNVMEAAQAFMGTLQNPEKRDALMDGLQEATYNLSKVLPDVIRTLRFVYAEGKWTLDLELHVSSTALEQEAADGQAD